MSPCPDWYVPTLVQSLLTWFKARSIRWVSAFDLYILIVWPNYNPSYCKQIDINVTPLPTCILQTLLLQSMFKPLLKTISAQAESSEFNSGGWLSGWIELKRNHPQHPPAPVPYPWSLESSDTLRSRWTRGARRSWGSLHHRYIGKTTHHIFIRKLNSFSLWNCLDSTQQQKRKSLKQSVEIGLPADGSDLRPGLPHIRLSSWSTLEAKSSQNQSSTNTCTNRLQRRCVNLKNIMMDVKALNPICFL